LKAGTVIRKFLAKDGGEVILRAPKWSDLDDMLIFINSLVEEGIDIVMDTKVTREAEIDWLADYLSQVEKDEAVGIAAEVDGTFVGQVTVNRRTGHLKHVGMLGIALKAGYRDIGIGSELIIEAEKQARLLGLDLITLEVFASNSRAIRLYEKRGYKRVGSIPGCYLKEGDYFDNVIMAKNLK